AHHREKSERMSPFAGGTELKAGSALALEAIRNDRNFLFREPGSDGGLSSEGAWHDHQVGPPVEGIGPSGRQDVRLPNEEVDPPRAQEPLKEWRMEKAKPQERFRPRGPESAADLLQRELPEPFRQRKERIISKPSRRKGRHIDS